MAVARLYVDPSFYENGQFDKVNEMISNIRKSFSKIVQEANWMDEITKLATLEKEKKMSALIGYPKWLFNDDLLNEYNSGVIFILSYIL